MNDDLLKSLWKAQDLPAAAFSIEKLQSTAKRLQRRIRMRNAMEYAACLLVICGFARYIAVFPYPLMRLGSSLVIAGTVFVAWQLRVRASSGSLPRELASLDFHRQQLMRQRDALRTVWAWYIAPLLPGVAVFRWGVETELDATKPFARGLGANLAIAAVFIAVILVNLYAARKLQRQIDRLPQNLDDNTP
jgi:hypothetical protein